MESFSDFIDGAGLFDLPLVGGPFTWSNERTPLTFSRLDRFLVSSNWEEKFSDVVQDTLARPISDHVPFVLDCGGLRSRRSPFGFENMWLQAVGFLERVQSWWVGYGVVGTPSHSLACKFCLLNNDLKVWNNEDFDYLVWRKNHVFSEIAEIDRMEGQGSLAESLKLRRVECQAKFAEIAVMEKISWRQKSRALWLKEGNNNTKFFHHLVNAHRRGNHIGRIQVDRVTFYKEEEICKGIVDFYSRLFTESVGWRPLLAGLHFDSISSEESSILEEPFLKMKFCLR
ncbi:uncharacterized protein LOC132269744 [Cornus florida]|uniref:uncharacterized protein LOC132269744 n=1 Tax=Cornus florida TaxID=4283 RepID=UPI00289A8BB2|nr:uncharacterized protein LOC132269744 [Cornus florida]